MAVFHSTPVTCSCGQTIDANLAKSVNVKRNPAVRGQILRGEFHRAACSACGAVNAVERPFYYSDPDRRSVFLVQPRGERFNHTRDGQRLTRQGRDCTLLMGGVAPSQLRVVYGLDELREKLVAQDAKFDDRHVELFKLFVLHEHPFLLRTPRLQLVLSDVTSTQLEFVAYHHNQPRSYRIQLPRFLAERAASQPDQLEKWVAGAKPENSLMAPDRRWVNFRRWSTRYSALDVLRDFAKTVAAGQPIGLSSEAFITMCRRLPRASELPDWAKKDLRTLFEYAKAKNNGKAQDRLFEVRFGIGLDDEWATNSDPNDIDTIWKLLRNAPIDNIEGNVKLKEIQLIAGGGGLYQWSGVVQIGAKELRNQESFEDVLRHEVGHAVHANKDALINAWLKSEFGWQRFDRNQHGINQWIELMGGWNKWGPVTAAERVEISNALVQALGKGGEWKPGPRPSLPASHPWHRENFGPRLATEQSHADWYETFPGWYRANGLAFFLNYWYAELVVVKESALDLVLKMPSHYAAMSHFEFFAELYSLYYDLDDPQRKVIPKPVATWLDQNIGVPTPDNPAPPPATATKKKAATALSKRRHRKPLKAVKKK